MKHLYHISRNFVEFGAFTAPEVSDFKSRGILLDHDYVRAENNSHWMPLSLWIKENAIPAPKEKAAAKPKSSAPRKRAASAAKSPKKAA